MKLSTSMATAITAFAAVGSCEHFNIRDFYYKHAANSNQTLAFFNVAFQDSAHISRCYAQATGPDAFHLQAFENEVCEDSDYYWSIDRSGPKGAFKFTIGTIDNYGTYVFPAKDVTTYQAGAPFTVTEHSYQQLTPKGGAFIVNDIDAPDPSK